MEGGALLLVAHAARATRKIQEKCRVDELPGFLRDFRSVADDSVGLGALLTCACGRRDVGASFGLEIFQLTLCCLAPSQWDGAGGRREGLPRRHAQRQCP